MRQRPRTAGFTLVEVAVAIVIVGTGSVALMQLAATCTIQNRAAADVTTAAMLAQHVQEMLADLPLSDPASGNARFGPEVGETLATFDDVDDFDGQTFSPPIDSARGAIAGLSGFSQQVIVAPINPKQLNGPELMHTPAAYTGTVRVKVTILRSDPATNIARSIYALEWVRVTD